MYLVHPILNQLWFSILLILRLWKKFVLPWAVLVDMCNYGLPSRVQKGIATMCILPEAFGWGPESGKWFHIMSVDRKVYMQVFR